METLAWDGWHEEGKDPQGRQNLNTFSVFEEDFLKIEAKKKI